MAGTLHRQNVNKRRITRYSARNSSLKIMPPYGCCARGKGFVEPNFERVSCRTGELAAVRPGLLVVFVSAVRAVCNYSYTLAVNGAPNEM